MLGTAHVLAAAAILLLTALHPARAIAADGAPPSKAAKGKPLHAFSWEPPAPGVENITGFIWIDLSDDPKARHPYASSPEKTAERSRRLPDGCAAVFIWKGHDVLDHPEDCTRGPDGALTKFQSPWLDHGVARVKARVTAFFTAFKQAGGRLDYLVLDYEGGLSNWCMKPGQVDAIFADPRAAALKTSLGFGSASALQDCSPPPYSLGDDLVAAVAKGDKPYMKWNRSMYSMLCTALNAAVYGPVKELFPRARASNYGHAAVSDTTVILDGNGHMETGHSGCFGNRGSREFYGLRQLRSRKLLSGKEYGAQPFDSLRWLLNNMRGFHRSSNVPFSPWVSHKSWPGDAAFDYCLADNDYYQELLYHLALMEADDFLLWNPAPWHSGQALKEFRKEADDLLVDACVRVLNQKLGSRPRRCITPQDIPWDSSLLVTGMQLGDDRVLWRVSVPRWDAKVKVLPSGDVLTTGKFVGLWYESLPGQDISFELVPPAR